MPASWTGNPNPFSTSSTNKQPPSLSLWRRRRRQQKIPVTSH
jgi:hypothetical protein